jgi:competence protein ComGC
MKERRKNILKQHYASRTYLICMILVPIFGLTTFLSAADIIPRYGITTEMDIMTGILILVVTCVISLGLYMLLNNTVKKISTIIDEGNEIEGTILKAISSKHALTIKYSFEFDNESCESSVHVAKKIGTRKNFEVGSTHKVYAMRNDQNKIESTLALFY